MRRVLPWLLPLLALVAVRVVLGIRSPIYLYSAEEYEHFRFFYRLLSDWPIGELSQYAHGDGRGVNGGGSLVVAILYVPVAAVLGPTQLAARAMALIWVLAGALVTAKLAERVLGPHGGAAALLALLMMPPSFVMHTTVTWANHAEGGVVLVGLLLAWVKLVEAEPGRAGHGWAAAVGFLLAFAPWFWPPAIVPSLLLLVPTAVHLARQPRRTGALLAGLGLALVPWLGIEFDAGLVGVHRGPDDAAAALYALGADRAAWWSVWSEAAQIVPGYETRWDGRWTTPVQWLEIPGGLLRIAAAVSLAGLALGGLMSSSRARLGSKAAVLPVVAATAVAIPLALVIAEVALPRRLTPVYYLWALGLAAPLRVLLGPGRLRMLRILGVIGLTAAASGPSWALALSGEPAPAGFEPHRYALCQGSHPGMRGGSCLTDLHPDHVALLHHLDRDPVLADGPLRNAALRGLDAGLSSDYAFLRRRRLAPCPTRHVRPPDLMAGDLHDVVAWRYMAAGLAMRCGEAETRARCGREAPTQRISDCIDGVRLGLWLSDP